MIHRMPWVCGLVVFLIAGKETQGAVKAQGRRLESFFQPGKRLHDYKPYHDGLAIAQAWQKLGENILKMNEPDYLSSKGVVVGNDKNERVLFYEGRNDQQWYKIDSRNPEQHVITKSKSNMG